MLRLVKSMMSTSDKKNSGMCTFSCVEMCLFLELSALRFFNVS